MRTGDTTWNYGHIYFSYQYTSTPMNIHQVATWPYDPARVGEDGVYAFRSANTGGVNFVFCDGSVKFLRQSIAMPTYQAFGTATYGLLSNSEKPTLMVYHSKAVFAGADKYPATVGEAVALEVVPVTGEGKTRFHLLANDKPVADAEGACTPRPERCGRLLTAKPRRG